MSRAEEFGARVRSLRKSRGLTLEALSKKIHCSKSYLHAIETARNARCPAGERVVAFARAFGVTADYLLGVTELEDKERAVADGFVLWYQDLPAKEQNRLREVALLIYSEPINLPPPRGSAPDPYAGAEPEVVDGYRAAIEDLQVLRHALGATTDVRPENRGYRNYYFPAEGSDREKAVLRLVAAGLMRRGGAAPEPEREGAPMNAWYEATEAGCKVAGLDTRQTRRAMAGSGG